MTNTENERKQIADILRGEGHSCEGLGVCMHAERRCLGACEKMPGLTTEELLDRLVRRASTIGIALIILIVAGLVLARY